MVVLVSICLRSVRRVSAAVPGWGLVVFGLTLSRAGSLLQGVGGDIQNMQHVVSWRAGE